jgi:hypothetical protein
MTTNRWSNNEVAHSRKGNNQKCPGEEETNFYPLVKNKS